MQSLEVRLPEAIDALLSLLWKGWLEIDERGGGSKELMEGGYEKAFWFWWEHEMCLCNR